ncbi:MAG TPA: DUF885 domain-containing protein [Acidobacteriota bacterium]|nr:DUF885 domain-containing protein [Acidobacteriota bacterium]
MKTRVLFCLTLIAAAAGCETAQQDSGEALHAIFSEAWDFRLKENPLFATSTGNHQYDDQLPDVSAQAEERRAEYWREILARLDALDRSSLTPQDQIHYDIFRLQTEGRIERVRFKDYLIPINADSGFHIGFARLPDRVPLNNADDYRNYIARLRAFPKYMEQHIELMREGLSSGFTQPRAVLEGYELSIESHVVGDPEESVFFKPFRDFPTAVPEAQRGDLEAEGRAAVREAVVPAYRSFLDFFLNEYRPGARTTLGASELPNGDEYYAFLIRRFTTLDLSAEEVHQIGLDEVARIRSEMEEIIKEVEFQGDFADFLTFLRTDSRFYAETPEELLKEACYIAKRMDAQLPRLFKTLPRLPYGVAPVPDEIAPKYTGGRYVGAPVGSTRPGYYWVNTYALDSRPLYTLEALTLHEAVPGHHLQNALRQELQGLPNFRRFGGFSAFGEGWGLYSEWLGLEAGFYTDPYSNFGRLTYEMWRACRLVVDTGLHAMGWTRQQARDYLASNTALSLHEIGTETDRYISWPGQALAYKLGELKIKELRRKAESELGERFDLRTFHDASCSTAPSRCRCWKSRSTPTSNPGARASPDSWRTKFAISQALGCPISRSIKGIAFLGPGGREETPDQAEFAEQRRRLACWHRPAGLRSLSSGAGPRWGRRGRRAGQVR